MGVDYYQCDSCDRGYRDDSEYAASCDCGGMFCSDTCGELENFTYEYDEEDGKGHAVDASRPITCVLCRLQKATDFGLLAALLKHYGLTRDEAFEIYKKQQAEHD
jgi:hypothetical protein